MGAPVNDIDIVLQAATVRLNDFKSNYITILASATNVKKSIISVSNPGGLYPTSITLTPKISGFIQGTINWSSSPSVTYSVDPATKVLTLLSSNLNVDEVTFTASITYAGITYTTSQKVTRISESVTSSFTKIPILVSTDANGNNGDFTSASTTMSIFIGNYDDTNNWTYSWSVPATATVSGATNTKTISISALSVDSATLTVTASKSGWDNHVRTVEIIKNKNGTSGLTGLGTIIAYKLVSQTAGSPAYTNLTTYSSTTPANNVPNSAYAATGSTGTGTGWQSTAPTATVGNVVWYSYGRYNTNSVTVDNIAQNVISWSNPIAASVFQDIKSDNWNGDSPPTSGNFGTGANAGYYLNKSEGSIYVQQAYVKGTLQAGSFIIGTVKLDNNSGRTLQQIESQAFNAVTTAAFDTTLQAKLTSGVTNILAGQNSNYQLFVAPSGSDKIVACHKDVLTADFSQATWPISAANTTGVPRTYLFIGPGGIFMGKYADTANATKNHRISIDANGDATFAGTVTATAGSFGGINIDSAKIYTGTGTWGNANTGFYADSAGQFSLKDKLTWNGTSLTINGAITATSLTLGGGVTVPAASVSGLATVATTGAAANISGLAAVATSGSKADVGLGSVSNLTPQNQAQTGIEAAITITSGGIAMSSGGYVKGGQTAYNTGTGFFLGYSTDNYKFSIGNPSGQRVTWDGSTFTVVGTIDTTSTIAGTNAGTVVSNAASGASAATTVATKLNKNASDTLTGAINVTTSGGFVAGTLTWDATGTRTGGYGIAMTAKGLVGFDSSGNSTFNISSTDGSATFKGAITSGSTISGATVVGGTIQTAASGRRIELNGSNNNKLIAYNSSGTNLAAIGGDGSNGDPLLRLAQNSYSGGYAWNAASYVPDVSTFLNDSSGNESAAGFYARDGGFYTVARMAFYRVGAVGSNYIYSVAGEVKSPTTPAHTATGSLGSWDRTSALTAGGSFNCANSSAGTSSNVYICESSTNYAIRISGGTFRYDSVTIASPPNNATTFLRGDGTWQNTSNFVKNGSVASNAIEIRWDGSSKAKLWIDGTYIANGFEAASSVSGLTNAYANITDGTTTAAASGSDTIKFRAGTGISVTVGSNDATHGDNVLITNTGVTSLTGTSNQVTVSASTGGITLSLPQSINTSSNVQFNRLGVGIAQQGVDGRIDASNDIVSYSSSDRNLKTNIQPITDPINKLFKLSGNTFTWKPELEHLHGYSGNDLGVIAQEVENIFPEAVRTNTNGYKSVRYEKLIPLLIEAIKVQQEQIDKLIRLVEEK